MPPALSAPKPDAAENGSSTQHSPKQREQSAVSTGSSIPASWHGGANGRAPRVRPREPAARREISES